MKGNFWFSCLRWLLLASLMLGLAQPSLAAPGQDSASQPASAPSQPMASDPAQPVASPPAQPEASPALRQPSITTLRSPEACNVPAFIPFGQDLETLVMGPSNSVTTVDTPFSWSGYSLANNLVYSATQAIESPDPWGGMLGAAALGMNQAVAVWRASSQNHANQLVAKFWNENSGWTTTDIFGNNWEPNLGPLPNDAVPEGSPVVVSVTGAEFLVFIRANTGSIYYKVYSGGFGDWFEIPLPITEDPDTQGYFLAKSDPVVIVQNPQRLLIFFLVSNTLTPNTYELYFNQSVNGTWYTESKSLGAPANMTLDPSAPVAVAPSEGRATVFVRARQSNLTIGVYSKTWAADANLSDWSDTTFSQVVDSVDPRTPIAVGARDDNHIALAYALPSGGWGDSSSWQMRVKEWSAANGWGAPTLLPAGFAAQNSTNIQVVSAFSDELMVIATPSGGHTNAGLYAIKQKAGVWETGWTLVGGESKLSAGTTAVAVPRLPHSLLVFGVYRHPFGTIAGMFDDGKALVVNYTLQKSAISTTSSANLSANAFSGGQRIVKVDAKPYWLNVYPVAGTWKVEVRDLTTWKGTVVDLSHGDPGPADPNRLALDAADMDLDGKDEVVIATMNPARNQVDISWLRLAPTGNPDTVMSITPTKLATQTYLQAGFSPQLSLAIGDLDGSGTSVAPDGKSNEVFISVMNNTQASFRVVYYQFTGGVLARKPLGTATTYYKDLTPKRETIIFQTLDSVTGRFDPVQARESLVFLIGRGGLPGELDKYSLSATSTGIRYFNTAPVTIPGLVMSNNPKVVTGDLNTDTADEVVIADRGRILVISLAPNSTPTDLQGGNFLGVPFFSDYQLATGDIDQDGRQEIIAVDPGRDGLILKSGLNNKAITASQFRTPGTTPLVADLDGDSMIATFDNCQDYTDMITVHGVIYTPPVFYSADKTRPYQNYVGDFSKSNGHGDQDELGWRLNYGFSISIGIRKEFNMPVSGNHLGGFSFMGGVDVMSSIGRTHMTSQSLEFGAGYEGKGGPSSTDPLTGLPVISRGSVLYSYRTYSCYTYKLHDPNDYNITNNLRVCTPPSALRTESASIEYWYNTAGLNKTTNLGWMALDSYGEPLAEMPPLNDILEPKYDSRGSAPVPEDKIIVQSPEPINVGLDSNPASQNRRWWFAFEEGEAQVKKGDFDFNAVFTNDWDYMGFAMSDSVTFGAGTEWSNTQSWTESVTYGGNMDKIPSPPGCAYCMAYDVTPFVYTAAGKTRGGNEYTYVVQDYYVNSRGRPADGKAPAPAEQQAPQQAAPQAPVVSSATHPNPDTWYPNNTPGFTWSQPAGDSTSLLGYRWFITQKPDDSPENVKTASANQDSYSALKDGLYYFHILAVGSDGSLSPVTHLAFRVDATPPTPLMSFNPVVPNGLGDWYTQPVTVTLSASDEASGLARLEFSSDGVTWTPYTSPLIYGGLPPVQTLHARATDLAGNTSQPVTTTIQIDRVLPSMIDADGYRVSYANIQDLPNGNKQLVLGGVLTDTPSGRNTVMLKSGSYGLWNPASEIGDFPMPAGNILTSTVTSLNWFYRPIFDVHGAYPFLGYPVDLAGNTRSARNIGTFWWEPDGIPDHQESRASASPSVTRPGDTVAFTLAARNTGFQESMVVLTDTLPAGVSVVEGSITEDGVYDPAAGQVVWRLRALWPGETRVVRFNAILSPDLAPGELTNQLDLEGYWEWASGEGIPPEPAHHFFSTSNTLSVLPAGSSAGAPRLLDTSLYQGSLVSTPDVTVLMNTSTGARYFLVREWTWNSTAAQWDLAQDSDWQPLENGTGLSLEQDSQAKYARYDWQLVPTPGVHYLGVWVADRDGRTSNLNEGNLIYTNLVSSSPLSLAAGQKVQYRLPLQLNDLAVFNLVVTQGTANLYAWNPRQGLHPDHYASPQDLGGIQVETLAFYAPESGVYILEIQAASDATVQLVTALPGSAAGLSAKAQEVLQVSAETPAEAARLLLEKASQTLQTLARPSLDSASLPANPDTLSTPWQDNPLLNLPVVPFTLRQYFLPLIGK